MATSNDEFWQRDANKTSAKNRVNAIDKPEQQRRRRDLILASRILIILSVYTLLENINQVPTIC
jgi:hypothetical protein